MQDSIGTVNFKTNKDICAKVLVIKFFYIILYCLHDKYHEIKNNFPQNHHKCYVTDEIKQAQSLNGN